MDPSTPHSRPRKRRQKAASSNVARQPNYRQLRHPFAPQSVFSEDELQAIHHSALRVLQELGIKVLLDEACAIYRAGGARVREQMVYIGADMVGAALASAPRSIRLRAINPAREQRYELGAQLFAAGSGCPNASDALRGRRAGDLQSYVQALKLVQSFDVLHLLGPNVEPQDVPIHERHYAMMQAQMQHCDKPMFVFARGRAQVQQSLELLQLGLGLSDAEFCDGVWAHTVINTNSPRMLDRPMAQGLIDFARAGQMSIVTPFCLAGAMAPVTVSGALTLQHAEALAAIVLSQLSRAGAPISYGGFSSNVDMKSGAPAFGTPEHLQLQIGSGQLARLIGLPWRSAAGAASNCADMQAATETTMGIWGSALANASLTIHCAGWLEGGLSFDFEKFINDVEALQTMAELSLRPGAEVADRGFEALAEVPPGGHFFAAQHTMERYRTAFYEPLVADLRNFESWQESGAQSSAERATRIWQHTLEHFEDPPSGGPQLHDRLAARIETLSRKGGAPPLD